MKKILLGIVVIALAVGCAYGQEKHPVEEILNTIIPSFTIEGSPIEDTLNLDFKWGKLLTMSKSESRK
jgi:hypothetical protein